MKTIAKSKRKVLLIEDEKIDAISVGRVLKELYPSVLLEVVHTGEQALEWIQRFRLDGERVALILMDMTLPRMHGLELLLEIKRNKDLASTPVVILSGNDSPEAVRQAYHSGACAYVLKQPELQQMQKVLIPMFDFGSKRYTAKIIPEAMVPKTPANEPKRKNN
jgi:CheY-like chemotaxis protein